MVGTRYCACTNAQNTIVRTPAEDRRLRTTIFYALGSATSSPTQVRKRYIVRTSSKVLPIKNKELLTKLFVLSPI